MVARRLFTRLIDDAALFPPGNAPMAVGVRDHLVHEQSWYADLVGPFLCPDSRLGELGDAVHARPEAAGPLRTGVIVTAGVAGVADAIRAVREHRRLELAAVEVPIAADDPTAAVVTIAEAAEQAGMDGLPVFIEVPRGDALQPAVDAIARHGLHAKLRTGGETPAAFPDEHEVAAFVLSCLGAGVRFKCTAGLHDAVRHTAADTGFEHHGFLNLLLAVRTALEGGDESTVAATLSQRDPHELVVRAEHLDDVSATAVRGWLRSYGSCSITEPVDELVRLGLLQPPVQR